MIPKMEACLRAVEGGVAAGHRHRRPGAALAAARDLHRRGHRHHGGAVMTARRISRPLPGELLASRPTTSAPVAAYAERYAGVADEHVRAAAAGARARRGLLRLGRRRHALPRPARRHRRQRPRPRATRSCMPRSRRSWRPSATSRTSSPRPPQIALAERLLEPARCTTGGSSSPTRAPRRTRRPSRPPAAPGGPRSSSTVGAFHGRSMGALALTWKPAYREPFEPLPGDVDVRPVRRRRRARRSGRRRDRRRSSSSRSRARTASSSRRGYLAAAREITARARRAALARRGADRHRPHRRVVRAHRVSGVGPRPGDAGQGARRRLPHRRLHRPRRQRQPARPGRPRHDVRRQPGRGHGRARDPGRDRAGRVARRTSRRPATHLADSVAGARPPAHRRGPRPRAAARDRPRAEAIAAQVAGGRAGGRLHRQRADARHDPARATA